MRDFKELKIWQKGMEIVEVTYDVIEQLPGTEKFGLASQCGRAAVSIPSNIAEGCARKSKAHFIQFLETALGSTYELQTQALIIQSRFSVSSETIQKLLELLEEEKKMIGSYIATISKQANSLKP